MNNLQNEDFSIFVAFDKPSIRKFHLFINLSRIMQSNHRTKPSVPRFYYTTTPPALIAINHCL